MAGRQEDIALIDTYLQTGSVEKPIQLTQEELEKEELVSNAAYEPIEIPVPPGGTGTPEDVAESEKALLKTRMANEKAEAARAREEEKRSKGMAALEKEQAKQEAARRKKAIEQAGKSELPGLAGMAVDAAKGPYELVANTASDVGRDLERVSTPGSILLPVAILILLYLAVIPVNGYPRLAWLWFVITGNAALSGTGAGIAQGTPPPPLSQSAAQNGQVQEAMSWQANRQLVDHYSYTGIEEQD